jgi:hypothetical protein
VRAHEADQIQGVRVNRGLAAQNDDLTGAQRFGLKDDPLDFIQGELILELILLGYVTVGAPEITAQAELYLHGQQPVGGNGLRDGFPGELEIGDGSRMSIHGLHSLGGGTSAKQPINR